MNKEVKIKTHVKKENLEKLNIFLKKHDGGINKREDGTKLL